MRRIIAFDPGGTTGWATWTDDTKADDWAIPGIWACGQLGPESHHLELDVLLGTQQTDQFTIVTESFEYRNNVRPGLVLDSVEYIGVMRRFCQERMKEGDKALVQQTASYGKGFVSDKNIRVLGLWYPAQKHAMDATRHLLAFMINSRYGKTVLKDVRTDLLKRGWK